MLKSSEFFNKNFKSEIEKKEIVSSESLSYYKGIGHRSIYAKGVYFSKNVQLIIFKKLPDSFDIDFINQRLKVGAIYVIPPDHKFHIRVNPSCEYFCFDIAESTLDKQFRQLLNAISYEKYKVFEPISPFLILKWVGNLKPRNLEMEIIDNLKREIIQGLNGTTILANLELPEEQYNLANRFLELLIKNDCIKEYSIKFYATKLGCCTRSLQRACLNNFKIAPQQMIKHHLFVKSLRLLMNKNDTIENVALKLGYATHNAFCKFTKTHIDLTPKEIRRRLIYSWDDIL